MTDICHHGGAPTSIEAYTKVSPRVREMQHTVLTCISRCPGAPIASDLMTLLPDMLPYTLRPRLTELKIMGLIEVAGRAKNPNGNNEYAYRLTDTGNLYMQMLLTKA